jgi:hypothetical protein
MSPEELTFLLQTAEKCIITLTKQRDDAVEKLQANTELLNKATEDIHVLLAFIKSSGHKPPKIHLC